MKEIYIIRHGQTDYNKKMIIQGSGIDSDLNETGYAQALQFYQSYRHIPFDIIITSKLKRSVQTVLPFIEEGVDHLQTVSLNEIGWGIYEGTGGHPKLRETYQWLTEEWSKGNLDARVEGGESAAELRDRCQRFLDYLKVLHTPKMLVCTHGRTLRCLMTLLKDETMDRMETYQHSNTGLYKVNYHNDQFHVLLENDTSHFH